MATSTSERGLPLRRKLCHSTNLLLGLTVLSTICGLGHMDLNDSADPAGLRARPPLVMDDAGSEDARSVTPRRRGGECPTITEDTLGKIQNVVILEKEGIVYCPIPKVASAEWKRALRWMVGLDDWEGEHTKLHVIVKNGLERLADRGLEETRSAFESDRLFRFLVVRDPAERLVSAFLNKCVADGYMSGRLSQNGAPSCSYLTLMPDLFPSTNRASLGSHKRLRELVEREPENTFFQFVSGIWTMMSNLGDACKIHNHHFRPQACFCDMPNLLPRFYVITFSNMSAEAQTLASKLSEASPVPGEQGDNNAVEPEGEGRVGGIGDAAEGVEWNGVDEARRTEISAFLSERFKKSQDAGVKVTHAAERKKIFLSERVMEVIYKVYDQDYDLLGEYFDGSGPP